MPHKIIVLSVLLIATLSACAQSNIYHIETNSPEQSMMHFGASDGWSMQKVGLWPKAQQNQIADWLFSTDNDANGQPLGIGLSVWRFNLGAGSAEQGDKSQIQAGTRSECFLQADGTYNWNKQLGQRRFLKLAKERGVPHFLAFMNSVPVYFTKNGLATNTGRDGTINLQDNRYADVARFVGNAIAGIEEHDGIHFDYLCPVNEPDGHWNWIGPKQEGSPATNREIARLVRAISDEFKRKRISTHIMFSESSDLRCLLGTHETDWQRGYQIHSFFSKDSTETYLGKTYGTENVIMAHSYWTNTPISYMRKIREQLRDTLRHYGARYWQTELCIMGNDEEIGGGALYDPSMRTALYVARVIHHDLVYGNAESWSWWRSMGGDYKDGLIRVLSDDNWRTGKAIDSKLLWTFGNYSRFIRPGARRYHVRVTDHQNKTIKDGETDPYGVMVSAYQNIDDSWVVVAINYSESQFPLSLDLPGKTGHWTMYRTSDVMGENLKPVGQTAGQTDLEPKSVTTFVMK